MSPRKQKGISGPKSASASTSTSKALQHRRKNAKNNVAETPPSSTYPSAYPTEDEEDSASKTKRNKPFRFLDLPLELRRKIYSMTFSTSPPVIDLDPHTFAILNRQKLLSLFRVSRAIYFESTQHFFSTHTFRLFPIYPGRYFKTKKPLLARIPSHYRKLMTSLELRLGPGWNNPPPGWVVNDALGLIDCQNVRVLKVFVECDPSDAIYKGFRMGDGVYERFSAKLLESVLTVVQNIKVVEFDGFPGVKSSGDMMSGLREVVGSHHKVVGWGPERGWSEEVDQTWLDAVLIHGTGKLLNRRLDANHNWLAAVSVDGTETRVSKSAVVFG